MSHSSDDTLAKLDQKLDTIIRLLAYTTVAPYESRKEKIIALHHCGLPTRDIAGIVGSTAHSVSQTISAGKKSSKKRPTQQS